jgi:ferredoxin
MAPGQRSRAEPLGRAGPARSDRRLANVARRTVERDDQPSRNTPKKLGLVIDLDTCVGCHACAVNCKEWNTGGYSRAAGDHDPYGADPSGAWLNRIHTFEMARDRAGADRAFPALLPALRGRPTA